MTIRTRYTHSAVTVILAAGLGCGNSDVTSGVENPEPVQLTVTTLAGGFDTIWELAWGPDQAIWVTERPGFISRVNPTTGVITRIGTVAVTEMVESGLLGMAFHPDFATQPYVFAMHTYSAGGAGGLRNRLIRMRYNGSTLGAPETLLNDIPGEVVHDGSRIAVGADRLLYVTTGDASDGALAQNRNSLAGKVLRLNLDGTPAAGNPFGTAIYSLGHRNPQGLVFGPGGFLYSTEHGSGDNDELNRIEMGRNYGWPTVRGRCDGDAGAAELSFCTANNVAEPLAIWSPTIAPSGLAWYDSPLIPEWRGSLLFTTLKGRALYRMTLSSDGRSVTAEEKLYEGQYGRLRDVLVAPDGTVYLGTSNRDGRGSPAGNDDRILVIRPG
ncbi:MAG: PQQ-dependent sugar dehydrogenase [Gemmatimonadota bacterium]